MSPASAPRSQLAGLAIVGLGASIAPLDFSVNVAFPAITAAFALETREIRWVAVSYVLTYGSLMLAFGALGDRIGYLRVFRAGLLLGALAFTLCAIAPTYGWLLAARVLQGIAVALTLSCAPALATALFDEGRRTWALSVYAAMGAIAGVAAPLAGGAAMSVLGWPGVYWLRVPVALIAFFYVPVLAKGLERGMERGLKNPLPPGLTPPLAHQTPDSHPRSHPAFDLTSMVLLATSLALLLLAPATLRSDALLWPATPLGLSGAALMAIYVYRQRISTTPFVPRSVLRDADFVIPNLAAIAVQTASFAIPLVVPFYLLRTGAWEPPAIGILLASWAGGTLAGSAVAPRLVRRMGVRQAAFAGGMLVVGGLAAIVFWPATPHILPMLACLIVQGAGIGLFQVAYSDIVVAALPISQRGVAGSLTMVTRTIGIVLGASLLIWVLQAAEAAALAHSVGREAAFMAGFRAAFITAATIAGACFALSSLRPVTWFGRGAG